MATATDYRQKAEALRELARTTVDRDEALAYNLRAVEYDYLAEQAEAGQVQQQGSQPPPAPQSEGQPAQQQQQVQPRKDDTQT